MCWALGWNERLMRRTLFDRPYDTGVGRGIKKMLPRFTRSKVGMLGFIELVHHNPGHRLISLTLAWMPPRPSFPSVGMKTNK